VYAAAFMSWVASKRIGDGYGLAGSGQHAACCRKKCTQEEEKCFWGHESVFVAMGKSFSWSQKFFLLLKSSFWCGESSFWCCESLFHFHKSSFGPCVFQKFFSFLKS